MKNLNDNYDSYDGRIDGASIEENVGYRFSDITLLREAMTHSSYTNEHGGAGVCRCNERLEFLGDSVLSLLVSRFLYSGYPDLAEGELTRLRAELVCERALYEYAGRISLGSFLLLGRGEEKGGARNRRSLLADAYEALIAAVYTDAGSGPEAEAAVSGFLMPAVKVRLERLLQEWQGADYKTILQQAVQSSSKGEMLEYVEVGEEGPDHDKVFTVEARIDTNVFGTGRGKTKKEAEQMAAREALISCGVIKE